MIVHWKSKYTIAVLAIVLLGCVIAIEQWIKYRSLQGTIGMYAYSEPYALRQLGKKGTYLGQVVDFKWNSKPTHDDDVKGYQPRYLIAREVVAGSTETQWWCSYLCSVSDKPPKRFRPSPFPELELLDHAIP